MSYYPSDPVFLTQGEPLSLINVLYRTRVARILADADNQVASVIQRQPLKVVTAVEQRVIDGYVTAFRLSANQANILARLRLPYTNTLEMAYLMVIMTPAPITIDFSTLANGALPSVFSGATWAVVSGRAVDTPGLGATGILNGDFEGVFTGGLAANWTEVGSPVTAEESTIIHGGAKSQKVTATLINDGLQSSNMAAGATGDLVNGEMWLYSTGGAVITLQRGSAAFNSRSAASSVTAAWQKVVVTFRRTNTGNVSIQARSFASATEVFYTDDASLRKVTFADCFALANGVANCSVKTFSIPYKAAISGTAVRWDSTTNPQNGIIAWHDGATTLTVDKLVAGVWTTVGTTVTSYLEGAAVRIECNGSTVETYYKNVLRRTDTISDAGIVNNTLHGMFSTYADNTFSFASIAPYGTAVPMTLYVAPTGNDTTGNGSVGLPYLTIAKANAIINANAEYSAIDVAAGTYAELVTVPRANLSYRVSGTVIIDGGGVRNGLTTNAQAGTNISGFEFANCLVGVLVTGSANCIVQNCNVHDCATSGIQVQTNSTGCLISNCIVASTPEGIYILSASNNSIVNDCEADDCENHGFYAYQATGVIFRNCFAHDPSDANCYGFEFENTATGGAYIRCWATGGAHGFIVKTSDNCRVDGCVAWDVSATAFYSKGAVGTLYYNNVAYSCAYGFDLSDNGGSLPASTGNILKNNIVVSNTSFGIRTGQASNVGLVSNYNDWFGNAVLAEIETVGYATLALYQGAGYEANGRAVDPAFVTTVYGGFALPAGSALLTAGESGVAMGKQGSTWNG